MKNYLKIKRAGGIAGRDMMEQSRVLVASLILLILVVVGPFDTHQSLGMLMLILYWAVIVWTCRVFVPLQVLV
jgi:hypothetical protein